MKNKVFAGILITMYIAIASPLTVDAEAPYTGYNYNVWDQSVPSPNGYLPERVYTGQSLGAGNLNNPQDMFVDSRGDLYILDTGNSRILVLDSGLKLKKVIDTFTSDRGKEVLKEPKGIFVQDDGSIYIADKGNERVVVMNGSGRFLKILEKPVSDILEKNFAYQPEKVLVDKADNVYVLAFGVYRGALSFDEKGHFNGFFGSNTVEATLEVRADFLWKRLLSKKQKESMERSVPIEYSNFDISNNFVFTCTKKNTSSADEIKKLNPGGKSVLRFNKRAAGGGMVESKNFGDLEYADLKGSRVDNAFTDIEIDSGDFINVLDEERGRVFQYDQESNLLLVFGGIGDQAGTFKHPVALESVGDKLLVLDSGKNSLTVFYPTEFGQWVRKAVRLYNDGLYEDAIQPWREVLKRNGNYELAYIGIGKALMKREEYGEAMKYFKLGHDQEGYSNAFKEYRTEYVRGHFSVFGAAAVLLILVPWLISKRKKLRKLYNTFRDLGVN